VAEPDHSDASDPSDDAWFESEESTRHVMIAEVQRIRRRFRARPWPVIIGAIVLSGLITYKVATRPVKVESEIVMALTEGSFVQRASGIPGEQLHDVVANVLLSDSNLTKLIEKKDLFPSRKRLGIQFAIDSLREQFVVAVWKNQFADGEEETERSARIGITVTDSDPDRAFDLARELSNIVISAASDQRTKQTAELALRMQDIASSARTRLENLSRAASEKNVALDQARKTGKVELAQTLELELAQITQEEKSATHTLDEVATSKDSLADKISDAGLDLAITVVDERRGQLPEHRGFLMLMITVVVSFAVFLGTAMVFGAFDSRVHDTEDIERLELPVLGHLPGFHGDHVGSLEARGAARARVPSYSRWRSQR
jgi:capsular polysaccharide biosynthesis protein